MTAARRQLHSGREGAGEVPMQTAETRDHLDRGLLAAARTAVLLVLLMPLVVTPDTVFPFVVGKALYARTLIEVALALWLPLAARNPSYRPVLSRLVIAFAVYAALSLLAGLTGVSLQRSLWSTYERMQGIVDLAHWLAFALVLTSLFRTREDWRYLLNFHLLVGAIMGLVGVALVFGWNLPVYGYLEEGQRISVTLGNPTYLGAYMLVNALVGAGLLVSSFTGAGAAPASRDAPPPGRRRGREQVRTGRVPALLWQRLFWGAAVLLSLWLLWESGTRASVIALAGALTALAVAYLLWGRLRRVKLALLAVLTGLVLLGLLVVWGVQTAPGPSPAGEENTLTRLMQTGGERDFSLGSRLWSVVFGLEAFAERPLLGWGPGNYIVAWGRHYGLERAGPGTDELLDLAHNAPVNELATKGALGFAGYLAMWLLLFWAVASRLRRLGAEGDTLALFLGAALAGYFIHNLALFDTPATFLQFVLLLAFAVSLDAERDANREANGDANGEGGRRKGKTVVPALNWLPVRRLRVRLPTRLPAGQWLAGAARRRYAGWAAAGFLAAALSAVIYLGNVSAYRAATEARLAQAHITAGWPARLEHYQRAIVRFPPLANQPRQDLLESLANDWEPLTRNPETFAAAMGTVGRAADEIMRSEPQLWVASLRFAYVYQNAAHLDPAYLAVAEGYVETAEGLTVNHPQVIDLRTRQSQVAASLDAAPEAAPPR